MLHSSTQANHRDYVTALRRHLNRSEVVGLLRVKQMKVLPDVEYLRREKDHSLNSYALGKVAEDLLGEIDSSNLSKIHKDVLAHILIPVIFPPSPTLSPSSIRKIEVVKGVPEAEATSVSIFHNPVPPPPAAEASISALSPSDEDSADVPDSGVASPDVDFGVSDIVGAVSDLAVAVSPMLPGPVAAVSGIAGVVKTGMDIAHAVKEKKKNLPKKPVRAPIRKTKPKVRISRLEKIYAHDRHSISTDAKEWLGIKDLPPLKWDLASERYHKWELHDDNTCSACDLLAHYYAPKVRGNLDGNLFRKAVFFHLYCMDMDFCDFYHRCVRDPEHWINSHYQTLSNDMIL